MSGAIPENSLVTESARDIRATAAEWHDRRERDDWSIENQTELDAWLDQSLAHRVAFLRVDAAWNRADRLNALGRAPADRTSEGERSASATRSFLLYLKLAAAALLVASFGSAAAWYSLAPRDRIFATPVGRHETISFADGSKVELNTNTILRARMTTEQRIVWLEKGEAFFHVKHDRLHPFIVIANNRRITDLGTQFSVRDEDQGVRVAVLQGKVWFDASEKLNATQSALLGEGDVAVAHGDAISVTRESQQALESGLSWRRGLLVFKHTPLSQAAAEFNRYNRLQLVIADEAAAKRTIGGTFPSDDVEAFARVAESALGLEIERRHDGTLVLR